MKDLIKNLLRESLDGYIKVYRCIDDGYIPSNKIEYFAVDKKYAQDFGTICYVFQLNTKNAKILNLNKWNKLYKDKTGINGNKYNRHQGIFVIGDQSITSNYEEELIRFSESFDSSVVIEFLNELKGCDAIYGEDAGYPNEYTFAVKNKNIITLLGKE